MKNPLGRFYRDSHDQHMHLQPDFNMVLGHLFSLRHLNFKVFFLSLFLVLKRKQSLKGKKKKQKKQETKQQPKNSYTC